MQAVISKGYIGNSNKQVELPCCSYCGEALSKQDAGYMSEVYICTSCMDDIYSIKPPYYIIGSLAKSRY